MADEIVDDGEQAEAKLWGSALSILRGRAGKTQAEAGEACDNMSAEGWRKYEIGKAPGIFRPSQQSRLTRALGFTRDDLVQEFEAMAHTAAIKPRRPPLVAVPEAGLLEIRERIQSDAWIMALAAQEDGETYPLAPDPRFPHAQQWLAVVGDDAMNERSIQDGDLAHIVDAVGIGYYPRTGDVVEVERRRFDGMMRELTLREIEMTPAGPVLWPHSRNQRWREPFDLRDGAPPPEAGMTVRILGLLLKTLHRF